MLVTFALITIEDAKARSKGTPELVHIESSTQTDNLIERFEGLRQSWKEWKAEQAADKKKDHAELHNLAKATDGVMQDATLAVADVRIALEKASSLAMERLRIIRILRRTKKAIREGQRITHVEGFKNQHLNGSREEIEWSRNTTQDDDTPPEDPKLADSISARRRRPLQCCMYVALAFAQLLWSCDMVAEYEAEVVQKTFDTALRVDDGKIYQQMQLKNHCLARLHPPTNRWPAHYVRFEEKKEYTPLMVRNPLHVGPPIITNRMHPKASKYYFGCLTSPRFHLGHVLVAI